MADVNINGLGGPLASPAADDVIPVWDTSAGQTLKIRRDVFVGATITGGGTIALGGYTLTVPATGTAALLATGTWTPNLTFGGATTGIAYASRGGIYSLIGDVCFIQGWIELSSKGSATGAAKIGGLPLTVRNTTSGYPPLAVQWINMTTNLVIVEGVFLLNTTTMDVNGSAAATATLLGIANTDFANNTTLRFAGHYFV